MSESNLLLYQTNIHCATRSYWFLSSFETSAPRPCQTMLVRIVCSKKCTHTCIYGYVQQTCIAHIVQHSLVLSNSFAFAFLGAALRGELFSEESQREKLQANWTKNQKQIWPKAKSPQDFTNGFINKFLILMVRHELYMNSGCSCA